MGVAPAGGGVVDGGQQHGVFDGEPVEGVLVVGGVFRGGPGLGCGEGERVSGRFQQPVGGVGGVQVVVEDAADGGVALLVGVGGVGEPGARVGHRSCDDFGNRREPATDRAYDRSDKRSSRRPRHRRPRPRAVADSAAVVHWTCTSR